jgi:hypothetical protein
MNDHELESRLRDLPGPALPAEWRASILATARCEARNAERNRLGANWPAVLLTIMPLREELLLAQMLEDESSPRPVQQP